MSSASSSSTHGQRQPPITENLTATPTNSGEHARRKGPLSITTPTAAANDTTQNHGHPEPIPEYAKKKKRIVIKGSLGSFGAWNWS
jgi:hypothetical protein